MKRRNWESKTKAMIVLQGLKGKPIADLCAEHQISQAQFYQWRDHFLSESHSVFEIADKSRREFALERENARLKHMIGELTMELKKKRIRPSMIYPKVDLRDQDLLASIREIKSEHPFWGYRRVANFLRCVKKVTVNKKRIERIMRRHHLQVKPNLRLKAIRTPMKSKPRASRPNQWWGIDMTKVLIQNFGWVYIVIVLDWYSKKIVGYHADIRSKTEHWLKALDMAVNRQFPDGARGQDLHLMSDNGCQPTSRKFMEVCSDLGIHQAFTSYNNPKGNADTERVNRTLKEELVWLREWTSPFVFFKELGIWVEVKYNALYPHSTNGGIPPNVFELNYFNSHIASRSPAA